MGDLGTLIPLSIAMITVNGLSFTSVFLMVGIFYVITGLYYRLPIPVQPLKVVAAIAIASPEIITLPVMAATGILFGGILLLLSVTGLINWISRIFTKPVVRGIQVGLGLILITKGIGFIQSRELLMQNSGGEVLVGSVPVNLIIGLAGIVLVLLLINSKRFPAALVIVAAGVIIGAAFGAFSNRNGALFTEPGQLCHRPCVAGNSSDPANDRKCGHRHHRYGEIAFRRW